MFPCVCGVIEEPEEDLWSVAGPIRPVPRGNRTTLGGLRRAEAVTPHPTATSLWGA